MAPNSQMLDESALLSAINSMTLDTGKPPESAKLGPAANVPHVLGIGTANPDRIVKQSDFAHDLAAVWDLPRGLEVKAERIAKVSGIEQRHLAIPNEVYQTKPWLRNYGTPSVDERNLLFLEHGLKLSVSAGERALADWGGDRQKITHLISVSNTTLLCPGLDAHLQEQLGLSPGLKKSFLSYMGCHGGLAALRTAGEIAAADPSFRVLLVCSELASAQVQPPEPRSIMNGIVASSIFGDGFAAMVVGQQSAKDERPIYEIHRSASLVVPGTKHAVIERLSSHGLVSQLSRELPVIVGKSTPSFVRDLVGEGLGFDSLLWAVHPGGRAIVDAVEEGCQLAPHALLASRQVLAKHGNMAAATVLFVLQQVRLNQRDSPDGNRWTVALAFGPGISVEGCMLRLL